MSVRVLNRPLAFWMNVAGCLLAISAHVLADDSSDYFEKQIRPILAERCVKCHGRDKQSGGLRLDSEQGLRAGGETGAVVKPGDVAESLLVQAIRHVGDLQMPPEGRLPNAEIQRLEQWVQAGAPWPNVSAPIRSSSVDPAATHWAFQPVRTPVVPTVDAATHPRNPIDNFVQGKLRAVGLTPAPEADRRTLIRRVTYTLTGLPPTEPEVQSFLNDSRENAYEELVDRLLNSPAYGEQWARHWLDVARYSDTKGYVYAREERFWVHAWTFRDWVVSALNRDLPYDRFLLLQIAADQVPDRAEGDLAAMGFLTLGRRFLGVQRDIIDDRIDVVTRGTMSLTVGCARCHDHKYDPIPTADYYSLYGVFQSSRERLVPLSSLEPLPEDFQQELNTRQEKLQTLLQERRTVTAERLRSRIGDYLRAQFELAKYPEEGFDQILATTDLLPSFVRRWQAWLQQAKKRRDPVFVLWHDYLDGGNSASSGDSSTGASLVNPLVAAAFSTGPTSRDDLIQRYADLFTRVDGEWQALLKAAAEAKTEPPTALSDPAAEEIRLVLYGPGSPCVVPNEPVVHTEYDFDSGTCNELWKLQGEVDRWIINAARPAPFTVILEDREVPSTPRIFRRGNPAQKGDEVPRQFLKLLAGPNRQPFQQGSGRLELARCIIDPQNPLTARVMVNRVWAHHFGTGLVSTPGDFGTRADPPSHPELLDWLASRFIDQGWSLKALHRLIITSATFRQSSTGPYVANQLNLALRLDPANRLLWRMNPHRLTFEELRDSLLAVGGQLDRAVGGKPVKLFDAPYPRRRTLYGLVDRQFLPGTLRIFDFANPDLPIPQRSDTTVPQQALFLMNHPLMLERSRELARAVPTQGTTADTVTELYRQVFQRSPTVHELRAAREFLDQPATDAAPAVAPTMRDWAYGYGTYDEQTQRVAKFRPLPHFTGTAWQGGAAWPHKELGWVQLTATGGHPGNDRAHASIRRWTAPADMTVNIRSHVKHEAEPGDGIRVFIVSSEQGLLASAQLHQKEADLNEESLKVRARETIDFVCDIGDVLNSDQHLWEATITQSGEAARTWNSKADFTVQVVSPLTPFEQLAQALLCTNEFYFVD